MKHVLLLLLLIFVQSFSAAAQTSPGSIKKVDDGLYLMYYDSTAEKSSVTKSTIVEFADYIVLIEMPISNGGTGAARLVDHREGGENVLETLKRFFPDKPLKYVMSSHWHAHSISSLLPFISQGITVVTTQNNFKRLGELIDSSLFRQYHQYIHFVENDSLLISDAFNSIVAYRFSKSEYPSTPTEDYLYFYLPKYNYLHCSCMFQRLKGRLVKSREMVSSRVEDLYKFMTVKQLAPQCFIGVDLYWDEANGMTSLDTVQHLMQHGITMSSLDNELRAISEETLVLNSDSIVTYLLTNAIPTSILNRAVYASVEKGDVKKALALARIQALLSPTDPNSWDTLGEMYYFLGETELAKHYERQSTRIDKNFVAGGEKAWKKELQDFQRKWAE